VSGGCEAGERGKPIKYTVQVGDRVYEVRPGASHTVEINGESHQVDFQSIDGSSLYSLLLDNRSWELLVDRDGDEYRISIAGELYVVKVQDERTRKIESALRKTAAPSGEYTLKAPMPGLVRHIPVELGEEVQAGQGLVILEAMKMENELRAPQAGTIKQVHVKPGDAVDQGQPLVVIR
jgi:pyruvate carboxylase subunit B